MISSTRRPRRRLTLSGLIFGLIVTAVVGVLFISMPQPQSDSVWAEAAAKPADLVNGERVFRASGCASCHAAPGTKNEARLVLSGGEVFKTDFGTFHAPNISPHPQAGIGNWSLSDFGNAVTRGVSRFGSHLYPAFPYGSYARMKPSDVADLHAFMKTLPASANVAPPHELNFPFNMREAVGLWKLLYLDDKPRVAIATTDPLVARGQYLVEGPGHCGECHTPRNMLGGLKTDQWLAGGPSPDGKGKIPNITPGDKGLKDWSAEDIATYLETGMTPEFDSVGGAMVEVVSNMAKLPAEDRQAIAAYLKAIPPR